MKLFCRNKRKSEGNHSQQAADAMRTGRAGEDHNEDESVIYEDVINITQDNRTPIGVYMDTEARVSHEY